jgi:hypothetical protein
VLHLSHGLGFGAGLLRYLRKPDWEAPERLDATADGGDATDASAASASNVTDDANDPSRASLAR